MMRPLVVIAKENAASENISEALFRLERFEKRGGVWSAANFDIAEYEGRIVDIVPSHNADYYIFASTHRSESAMPCFTVHTPGNWGDAKMGGKRRMLNIAYASKQKVAFRKMKELSDISLKWVVCMEVDHHGPTLEKPVLFVEIGSSEKEWVNREAGKIAAQGIIAAINSSEVFPSYVGFGGTHYAPKFNSISLQSEKAFGHIISGYSLENYGVDEEMVKQAIEKNVEKIESVLIDWKGVGGEKRRELIEILGKLNVKWERT